MVNTRANTIVNSNSVENQLASMMIVITRLIESVIALENKINHGEGTSQRRENLGGQNFQTWNHFGRLIKVEFPKFDGDDVQGWLYIVNKLFEIDQEIRLISMHVFDRALNWHKQIMKRFGEIVTWDVYETQVYQDSFEASLNKVEINEYYVVSLFINGLKEEIAYAIRMFKHATLIDVFCLFKLQEANIQSNEISQIQVPTVL
ncbi:hypothetical protein Tco_1230267 [Tanacetum coccineum]